MAVSFEATSAIVDLAPTAKPLRYARGNRWLLWPGYAYRVFAPHPVAERLNLFQRSVLALCVAGVVRATEVGHRLALGEDLAAHVLAELTGMGLLDSRGTPCERGLRLLEQEPDDEIESIAGYVFVDPFDGALWPRFHRGALPYTDGELRGTWATFQRGSVGDPRPTNARVIWPTRNSPRLEKPKHRDILRACSASFRAEFSYARSLGEADDVHSFESVNFKGLKQHLDQVVVVDADPEPIFVTTFLFVPEDARRGAHWQVCDPFGLGPSMALRSRIERILADHDVGALREAIEETTNEGFSVDDIDLLDLMRLQASEASSEVDRRAGFNASDWPDIWELLLQMEKSRVAVGAAKDVSGREWDLLQKGLRTAVRRAFEAMEECLAVVARAYPCDDIWLPLEGSLEENGALLANLARDIGFEDDAELPCFEELLFTGAGPVKGVVIYGGKELVAALAASLLSAVRFGDHPARRCAAQMPSFLVFLHALKRTRDGASHHNVDGLDRDTVFGLCSDVYTAIDCLLPKAPGKRTAIRGDAQNDGQVDEHGMKWTGDIVFRVRAQAARRVDSTLGDRVRELPTVRDAFVEQEHVLLELEMLTSAGATDIELTERFKDHHIACASAVEAAAKTLLTNADVTTELGDDRHANATKYAAAARELGFVPADDGGYHQDLLMVRPDRARAAAATRDGALNALLLVATMQAALDEGHPLREVARTTPRFLLFAGAISEARGHGDAPRAQRLDDVRKLRNTAIEIGKAVLEAVL